MRPRAWWWKRVLLSAGPALVLFLVLALMPLTACSSDSDDRGGSGFVSDEGGLSAEQLEEVEGFIGVPIPESAVDDETRAQLVRGGPDDALRLLVVLPPADVQPFLDRVGFDQPLRDSYQGVITVDGDPDWFRTDELTEFRGVRTEADRSLQATVDVSNPDRSAVHLLIFER